VADSETVRAALPFCKDTKCFCSVNLLKISSVCFGFEGAHQLKHNGSAVWFVAPASRRKWFLLFRLDGKVLSRQKLNF
jgi:hypothetical protein